MVERLLIERDVANGESLNADGAIRIEGSVRAATVKARGDIEIAGDVTAGATLSANGNIVISGGIKGSTTRVVAMGDLHCRFILRASTMAVGDIHVANHISNAQVRSGKRILIGGLNPGHSGRVTGGEVFAAMGIAVGTIGVATKTKTIIGCQPNMQTAVQMAKIRRSIEYCDSDIKRIARTLGAHSLSPDMLERIMRRTPPSKKHFVREILQKLKKILSARGEQVAQLDKIKKSASEELNGARVDAGKSVFSGSEVHFGEVHMQIDEDLQALCFYWDGKSIQWKLAK